MLSEGRYDLVAPHGAVAGVLVLHPHPDMGGNRFNPVVEAVFRAARDGGWAACRFDFSSSDVEVAAVEATAALDLLPATPTTLVVGYSFGAVVASHLTDPRVTGWVLVAPPFGRLRPAAGAPIGSDERPKLLLAPAHDQFCPPAAAVEATAGWTNTVVETVASADHFLGGATAATAQRALELLRS